MWAGLKAWLKAHLGAAVGAVGAILAAVVGLGWLWGRGRSRGLLGAESVGEARGRATELEKQTAADLETALAAAESRAETAGELERVRLAIRAVEAESGALTAIEVAEAFNRRAKGREP